MAKSTKSKKLKFSEFSSGWAVALSSMVLALIFLSSVIDNSLQKVEHHHHPAPAPLLIAGLFALIAAVISIKWEKKARLLVGLSLGVVAASCFIWQFGLH